MAYMNLYFGNFVTTASTILVLVLWAFIVYSVVKQKEVEHWGRRIAGLALFGLLVCCFVATRDGYHLSVKEAVKFPCKVTIEKDGKEVDAKRILGLMALGVKTGQEIILRTDGEQEKEAIDILSKFLQENL